MSARESGDVICNRYELVDRIGAGGHGEIWSAIDEHDGQRVALKFLREDLATSVEAWAVLNHESQMARRLNHPGILRSGTPIRDDEQTVLPMEYAGGGDLKRLRGQSYLRSVPVLIRIAEILAHAHARGVVHRDLKPGNVLFDEQGSVRLADFGASGLSGSTDLPARGSPFSASPQQLQDLPASPSDDIYGLGALAYELLSGHPPYYPQVTAERVLNEPVPELKSVQPAPARLVALILRMLEKDPAARPASMLHVVEGLNQGLSDTLIVDDTEPSEILSALPASSPPPVSRPAVPAAEGFEPLRAERRVAVQPRLLPAAVWLGGAGVVGAVIVALLVLHPWRKSAPDVP
ncbi:MAG: serine/threonine-protein kinase, partial [Steroidobacteraceae bacterium]